MKSTNTLKVLEYYLSESSELNDLFHEAITEERESKRRKLVTKLSTELILHMEDRNKYRCRY